MAFANFVSIATMEMGREWGKVVQIGVIIFAALL